MYLQTYYLPAFTVTMKKEKNHQEQEIKISRITAREKKEKISEDKKKKKEKAHFVTPVEKKSRDMQSIGQKKIKTHRKMPQCYNYKSAQYEVEPITYVYIYIYSYPQIDSSVWLRTKTIQTGIETRLTSR